MTEQDNSERSRQASDRFRLFPMLTRYDLVLAFMPTVFMISIVASYLLSIPIRTALLGASLVGTVSLIDALFLNPPRRTGRG